MTGFEDQCDKTMAFCLFDGVEELDFVGPWQMAAMWREYANGPKALLTFAEDRGIVKGAKGLAFFAEYDFDDLKEKVDYLLIPGGYAALDLLGQRPAYADVLGDLISDADAVLTVCSGSAILADLGVLKERNTATNHKLIEAFNERRDIGKVIEERFVQDRELWTSGGVSAGMDMMLAFIQSVAGAEAAGIVQRHAEYFPDGIVYGDALQFEGAPKYLKRMAKRDEPATV